RFVRVRDPYIRQSPAQSPRPVESDGGAAEVQTPELSQLRQVPQPSVGYLRVNEADGMKVPQTSKGLESGISDAGVVEHEFLDAFQLGDPTQSHVRGPSARQVEPRQTAKLSQVCLESGIGNLREAKAEFGELRERSELLEPHVGDPSEREAEPAKP